MSRKARETIPFIGDEMEKSREYSMLEESESEYSPEYSPSRPQQSRHWVSLLTSFLFGLVTAAAVVALWKTSTTNSRPSRYFPEFRNGSDPQTGLPLSWSHGDCGNSPEDARERGCQYSIVLHSWLPKYCLTDEDIEDQKLMYEERDWPYETQSKNLTVEELYAGDYHHFITTFDWHVVHCMYVWKRLHRISLDGNQKVDSYTANFHHTNHCVKMIGGHPEGMKDSGTKIFVKYPTCA